MNSNLRNPASRRLSYIGALFLAALAALISIPRDLAFAQNHSASGARMSTKAPAKQKDNSDSKFIYFFDAAGDFIKIGMPSETEVAHGQIAAAQEVAAAHPNFDGCILCDIHTSPSTHLLYAVIANGGPASGDQANNYRIVALEDSQLKQIASSGPSEPPADAYAILITPDGKQMLASYQASSPDQSANQSTDQLTFALSIYDLSSLKQLKTLHEETTTAAFTAGTPVNLSFTKQAYFGPQRKIYDRFDTIAYDEQKLSKSTFDPFELLAGSPSKQLQAYASPATNGGRPYFAVDYADATSGKILVTLNAGKSGPEALLAIDAQTHTLSPPIPFPQLTVHTIHLTPDAGQVLVEEFTWRKNPSAGSESSPDIDRTGRYFVFDTSSGKELHQFATKELLGFQPAFLCISPDGELAFYTLNHGLYSLDLRTGSVTRIHANAGFRFDKWTLFAFAGN